VRRVLQERVVMLWPLIALLTVVPAVELMLLLEVHRAVANTWGTGVGLLVTVGSLVVSGVLGASLARRQGLGAIRDIGAALDRGESPGTPIIDGALIVFGGALLLAPGYLTDLVGFSLLVPWTRRLVRRAVVRWLRRKIERGEVLFRSPRRRSGPDGPSPGNEGLVIDVTPEDET
jgi:UPF0716 protein FxsA